MLGAKTEIHVSAHLDAEGNASVTVRGSRKYGKKEPRDCFVSREITDKKTLAAVGKVLKDAIADVHDEIDEHAVNAAMEAHTVAFKKGETL